MVSAIEPEESDSLDGAGTQTLDFLLAYSVQPYHCPD